MTEWAELVAALHRSHVDAVRVAAAGGQDIAPLATLAVGDDLVPVLAETWQGVAAGLAACASRCYGRPVRGIVWHGVGIVDYHGNPAPCAWTWGQDRGQRGHGLASGVDVAVEGRVIPQLEHVKDLSGYVWPRLLVGEQ